MEPVLIICIDGLGKDMISMENTPFLYELSKKNFSATIESPFAFTGIEYSFFTGLPVKKSKVWLEFVYSENSIFKNPLLKIVSFNSELRNYFAAFLQYIKGRTWISGLHNIPKKKIKYFDTSLRNGLWKSEFFNDKSFVFYKWPFFVIKDNKKEKTKIIFKYESDDERLKRLLKIKDKNVYYTQLMGIDKTCHKFGKKSIELKKTLKNMDKIIEKNIQYFLTYNKNGTILIWSDHGFADIKEYIDIEKALPKRKDFLCFIAGTTASFWFKNEESKKEILEKISKIEGIKLLDEAYANKHDIPVSKKYGAVVFFVEKGKYFFPNFYQKNEKERFAAMHGYPEDKELNSIAINNKKKFKNKKLKIDKVLEVLK
jgi:predicted AlkP superfamily pyrophosphatase or phosphodiesterase